MNIRRISIAIVAVCAPAFGVGAVIAHLDSAGAASRQHAELTESDLREQLSLGWVYSQIDSSGREGIEMLSEQGQGPLGSTLVHSKDRTEILGYQLPGYGFVDISQRDTLEKSSSITDAATRIFGADVVEARRAEATQRAAAILAAVQKWGLPFSRCDVDEDLGIRCS